MWFLEVKGDLSIWKDSMLVLAKRRELKPNIFKWFIVKINFHMIWDLTFSDIFFSWKCLVNYVKICAVPRKKRPRCRVCVHLNFLVFGVVKSKSVQKSSILAEFCKNKIFKRLKGAVAALFKENHQNIDLLAEF